MVEIGAPCPPPLLGFSSPKNNANFQEGKAVSNSAFQARQKTTSKHFHLQPFLHPFHHPLMPSPHLSQALEVYTQGTQAWFTDDKEGWVSASLVSKDITGDNVKMTFRNDDDESRVTTATSNTRLILADCCPRSTSLRPRLPTSRKITPSLCLRCATRPRWRALRI